MSIVERVVLASGTAETLISTESAETGQCPQRCSAAQDSIRFILWISCYVPGKEHCGHHQVDRQPALDVQWQRDTRAGRLPGGAVNFTVGYLSLPLGVTPSSAFVTASYSTDGRTGLRKISVTPNSSN